MPGTVSKAVKTTISNVTSKTFGILVQFGGKDVVSNLIFRNDKVPADVTKEYGTVETNQSNVELRLMEGLELIERAEVHVCSEIGNAILELPPGLPANSPIIVNFNLNEQGRIEVTATDPRSKNIKKFEVQTAGVMSEEEVEKAKTRGMALIVS